MFDEMLWEAAAAAACGTLNASAPGDAERLLLHRRGNSSEAAKSCPAPQSGTGRSV